MFLSFLFILLTRCIFQEKQIFLDLVSGSALSLCVEAEKSPTPAREEFHPKGAGAGLGATGRVGTELGARLGCQSPNTRPMSTSCRQSSRALTALKEA